MLLRRIWEIWGIILDFTLDYSRGREIFEAPLQGVRKMGIIYPSSWDTRVNKAPMKTPLTSPRHPARIK